MDTLATVARIGPAVDNLVFAIAPAVSDTDRQRLAEAVRAAGGDDPRRIIAFAEFLQTGLDPQVAELRMPYDPDGAVREWLESLTESGVARTENGRIIANDRLRVAIDAVITAQTNATRSLWGDRLREVELAIDLMGQVATATSPDHTVAGAHRSLADPDDPCLLMSRRLVTMRYIRQHDHRMAWTDAGCTKRQILALTELWHGGVVDDDDAMTELVDRGLATPGGALTDEGTELREQIEKDTNARNALNFTILGDSGTARLATVLEGLGD